jgi:aspartate/methionine/tyrosine aminotransferase
MSELAKLPERYINEVVSLCLNTNLLNDKKVCDQMLPESIARAKSYVPQIKVGAYSCSKGIETVRKRLADRIAQRDNLTTDPDDFYLTYGGMDAYQHILSLFSKNDSVSKIKIFLNLLTSI